jgi:hypothetical protein
MPYHLSLVKRANKMKWKQNGWLLLSKSDSNFWLDFAQFPIQWKSYDSINANSIPFQLIRNLSSRTITSSKSSCNINFSVVIIFYCASADKIRNQQDVTNYSNNYYFGVSISWHQIEVKVLFENVKSYIISCSSSSIEILSNIKALFLSDYV